MKLMTDGNGRYSIDSLFASNNVEEHNEYPIIAKPIEKAVAVSSNLCIL
jgi:hypothetical protein